MKHTHKTLAVALSVLILYLRLPPASSSGYIEVECSYRVQHRVQVQVQDGDVYICIRCMIVYGLEKTETKMGHGLVHHTSVRYSIAGLFQRHTRATRATLKPLQATASYSKLQQATVGH